jgi:polysaccharide biosynthesis protein PslH
MPGTAGYSGAMQDLLLLTPGLPHPSQPGSSMRAWRMLRHLSGSYRVYLGCFAGDSTDRRHEGFVRQFCHGVFFARHDRPSPSRAPSSSLLGLGRSRQPARDTALMEWVERVWNERRPTRVLALCPTMAPYALMRPDLPARRVLDRSDIVGDALADGWRPTQGIWRWLQARELRALMLLDQHRLAPWDASLLNSGVAVAKLRQLLPEISSRIHHVPDGIDTVRFSPGNGHQAASPSFSGRTILLAGLLPGGMTDTADSHAEADAVRWFASQVLPKVRSVAPDCRLVVATKGPAPVSPHPAAYPGVTLALGVEDIRPWLAQAAVVVAPFQKSNPRPVLEAMAMARPVVAAPGALGGYLEQIERDLWLAGEPADFAHAVLAALHPPLGMAVGRAARARILASHSWEAGLARLDAVLEGRAVSCVERARPITLG